MSWIPFYLTQYDKYWSREKNLDSPLTMLPSEYFLRQFYATFFNDPPSRWVFGTWGSDNLMWSERAQDALDLVARARARLAEYRQTIEHEPVPPSEDEEAEGK